MAGKTSSGTESWIKTFSGVHFRPLSPRVEDICLVDIAHSLANQCRFSGHTVAFYSVGQHSVLVARTIQRELTMSGCAETTVRDYTRAGLMHDAPEAYLVDIPSPVKRIMPEYIAAETLVWEAIRKRFGLADGGALVRQVDFRMLYAEARDLLGGTDDWDVPDLPNGHEPIEQRIHPWPPQVARAAFLGMARELGIRELDDPTVTRLPCEGRP